MAGSSRINILFTCVGRRYELVQAFRAAAKRLGVDLFLLGTDANPLSPALFACDKHVITRPIADPDYIPQILELVREHRIDLVIPTIDTELKHLATHRQEFQDAGARVLVSDLDVIEICQDKRRTYRFLREHGFGAPETRELGEVDASKLTYPVFLKPWNGSASKGNAVARDEEEFGYWSKRVPHCIVQPYLEGQEYTSDVYVDFQMAVRCVVPRRRIEVRGGEVSKGQTARIPALIEQCTRLVEALGAGPGVITIQAFVTLEGEIRFIEVNPRFGGGAPLSIEAGADFPSWIIQETLGAKPRIRTDGWKDGLCMLRYDAAVWIDRNSGQTGQGT
ncbi:MAG: ATP-grasp domain-containing protein [Phycisphaerae bacterium]|nr:ATP-grasp domain-containing protein [Phycisphaerae bacterium]